MMGRHRHKPPLTRQYSPESGRQPDVLHPDGTGEKRGYLLRCETGDAAADLGDEESLFRMAAGKIYEPVDIRRNGRDTSLHGRYRVAPAVQADTLAPHGAKTLAGEASGTAAVHAGEVAPEDEYLVGSYLRYSIR